MFGEYEDTINDFLARLRETNPDRFTDREWDLIWAYTKSDGCTGVIDIFVLTMTLTGRLFLIGKLIGDSGNVCNIVVSWVS